MCEKLFKLCKLQLGAIFTDLEKSVESVNAAATRIMRNANAQEQAESGSGAVKPEDSGQLNHELKKIIVGLQFHDELTQRLEHLQALLALLEEQPGVVEQEDNEKLLSRLSKIFSSNAEFNQLRKVFPGCQVASPTDAIELF